MAWSSYLDFLSWLYGLGDKLPQTVQLIQVIIQAIGSLVKLHTNEQPMMGAAQPSGAEERLEQKITQELASRGVQPIEVPDAPMMGAAVGAWDGTILRQIFAFLQANPQLVAFLLSLLKIT